MLSSTANPWTDRTALAELQRGRLRAMAEEVVPRNTFWRDRFAAAGAWPTEMGDPGGLGRLPLITKAELGQDQGSHPPYGRGLTYPLARYSRLHQTSGTSGQPLRWLDTPESWNWLLDCWDLIYGMVGLRADDRLFFPFSFGPFLGFWTAFEAAVRRGNLCLPGGGMSSGARLRFLLDHEATVVLCTPTYALRLAEVAREQGIDLAGSPVRALIVAGEPGGSIPGTRARIEAAWGARVFDHSGLTEVGPATIECSANPGGLHILETEYVAEVLPLRVVDCSSADCAEEAEIPHPQSAIKELVLTNLGRWGSPLFRYRTGDLVRLDARPCPCGCVFVRLEGGILGRTDDMIHLRGNNVYPSALEAVVRRFDEVEEFRVEVDRTGVMPAVRIEVETTSELAARIRQAIQDDLLFRAEVVAVPPGSLPRSEMKARRFSQR